MRQFSLREYEVAEFAPVPPDLGRGLAGTGLVDAAQTLDGRLRLTARSVVGAARVEAAGEVVELRVHPKLPIRRLMWMLSHAAEDSGWREDDVAFSPDEELVPAIAAAFVAVTRRALAPGVLHGYKTVEAALPVLRGRLREADQVRGRLGLAPPLEVRYDDYCADIPENQILLAAVQRLTRLPGVRPRSRRELHRFAVALCEVTALAPRQPLPATRPNRLSARYEPALRLARLILAGQSTEQPAGDVSAVGFAFDLNKVFERWLTVALGAALTSQHGGTIVAHHRVDLDETGRVTMYPDITWWRGGECAAVIDAKYKALHGASSPNADVYQMLAYCSRLGLRHGHLIYGTPARGHGEYHLVGSGVRVAARGLDLAAPLAAVRAQLAALAADIAQAAP
ncbi:McrC family protein [Dactylosporangium sp. NPDC000521]|uniref:McrC family protein n=1 Tax=Dactylosporangium sp. NPDC000521 TaxID=3363975 RepID=UPI0036987AB9